MDNSIFQPINAEEPWSFAARGKLFLIVGPAGAGKTTILNRAKKIIGADEKYAFPKRVIVKSKSKEDEEDFEEASSMEFTAMQQNGEFAFWWTSHSGVRYGIKAQDVDNALTAQKNVVIQVSRSVIEDVRAKYGETNRITAIETTADPTVIGGRLSTFKKLTDSEIKEKLKRTETLKERIKQMRNVTVIENNGSIEEGVNKLLEALLFRTAPAEVVSAPPLEQEKDKTIIVAEPSEPVKNVIVNENVVTENIVTEKNDQIADQVAKEFFGDGQIRNLIHQKAQESDKEHKQIEEQLKKKAPGVTTQATTTTTTPQKTKSESKVLTKSVKKQEGENIFVRAFKWIGIVGAVSAIGIVVARKFHWFGSK